MKTKHELFVDIIVNFEWLQSLTYMLIGDLLNDKHMGHVLFKKSNTSYKIVLDYYKRIYEYKIKDRNEKERFDIIYKELIECNKLRNEVAHTGLYLQISEDSNEFKKIIVNRKDNDAEWTKEKLKEYDIYILKVIKKLMEFVVWKKE